MAIFPLTRFLHTYSCSALRGDVQSGVTVAIFAVPQCMAYAMLAGVPPVHGLYAALVAALIAGWLGASPFLNSGPTNSAALLTAAAIAPLLLIHDEALPIVLTLTLMVGILRLALGLCRVDKMLAFVPESAFLGFMIGAGLLIVLGQLHHLLGVQAPTALWVPAKIVQTFGQLPDARLFAVLIGLGTFLIMALLERKAKAWPVALLAIVAATLVASLLNDAQAVRLVGDIAPIPSGLPGFSVPALEPTWIQALFPAALAIAVVGLIEAASVGQLLALRHRQPFNARREFVGQGIAQIVTAFLQGIPSSVSYTRTLLTEISGAVTRFTNVVSALVMAGALFLAPHWLEQIPISALAGLLMYIGIRMIDLPRIRRVMATAPSDATILLITLIVTVGVKIEYGLFVGIVAAALTHLQRTRDLHLVEYVPDTEGRWQEIPYERGNIHRKSAVVAIGVAGDLFYGVAAALRQELSTIIEEQHPRHLILRVRRAYSIDYSCWSVLFDIAEVFDRQGGRLYLCGIRPDFHQIIQQAGMTHVLKDEQIFPATATPFEAFEECMKFVREHQ
jgi:sulfate permease, SulP family